MALPAGTSLGSYRVAALLGAGGMGEVYRAHDTKLGRDVAIKVLPPSVAGDSEALARFEREARAVAALSHPNIRGIFDLARDGELVFAVMELLDGEPLRAVLDRGPLPKETALQYARETARGLAAAHEKGIVHRDLKPENLFVTNDGFVKILDFGLAKQAVAPKAKEETSAPTASVSPGLKRASETEPGVVLGTLDYMSPEQVKGLPLDARSDVFSFGAVLHEMLTGTRAFHRETIAETMAAILRDEPAARPPLPADLAPVVKRSLAKRPSDRYPSAKELAADLARADARGLAPVSRKKALAAAAAVVAVAAVAALVFVAVAARRRTARPESAASAAAAAIRSIAVLPLDNVSGDAAQDFFAEGMTDELTTDLATISSLRVISRGSAMQFAGKGRPPAPEIAKRLDVDAIVEGSVIRSGDRVRITAQLVDARADRHLWARSFERSSKDVLALQDELASAIAREIHVTLTPGERSRLESAPSLSPEAHDAYLKGRYFFNRASDENLKKAIDEFEKATRLAPDFALAWSGVSDAYLWAGFNETVITSTQAKPKAKEAAEKAIALDDASAEAHTSLANYKLWIEYDWEGCEREFRRAIELNPNYAFAHDQFDVALAFQGRLDEAAAEGKKAATLDPLTPQNPIDDTVGLAFQKRFDAAKENIRRASELDPSFFFVDFEDGWDRLQEGKPDEAIPRFLAARKKGAPPFVTAWLAYAYGAAGDRASATREYDELKRISLLGVAPFSEAVVMLGLGENARAMDALERAHAADSQWLGYLGRDRIFDPLRSDPRFAALLKKIRLAR